MRRLMMMLGAVLLAAFMLVGAGAASVSASGDEFLASTTGKSKSRGLNTQVFKTGSGTIECTTVSGAGKVEEIKSVTHREVLTYSGCTGFGVSLTVSAAHFEFNANGSAYLEKRVTVSSESLSCEVFIEPQTLDTITYSNNSGKVAAPANVSGIHSTPTGGVCGSKENKEGSYTGSIEAELEGGTLEWKS